METFKLNIEIFTFMTSQNNDDNINNIITEKTAQMRSDTQILWSDFFL